MKKRKDSIRKQQDQRLEEPMGIKVSKAEYFHFGEASIRVDEVDVNTWQCSVESIAIGFVTYTPEHRFRTEGRGKDYGYRGFHSPTLEGAEKSPATDINKYSSLRNAVRAVVACHYSGKRYTYINDNVAVLDGKLVPESVFKGRKVIKPVLAS